MTAHIAGETPLKVLVEGWRFISHSYAMVNQWQMLAMLGRRDVALTIFDLPFLSGDIPNIAGLFDPQREDALRRCARAETTAAYDVCYRIAYPYTLRSEALSGARCGKTLVFGTAEYRHLTSHYLTETPEIGRAHV